MRKIFAVALTEYRQVVLTVSFLISLLLPLLIYGGLFAFGHFFGDKTDLRERPMIVIDRTGILFDDLLEANRLRNRSSDVLRNGRQVGPEFAILPYPSELPPDNTDLLVELSESVRNGDLFGFAIIGPNYMDPAAIEGNYLRYFSDSPTFNRLPDWFFRTVRDKVEERRFAAANINRREINTLLSHNELERYSLAAVDAAGNIVEPREDNRLAAALIPIGLIFLIFLSIQMTTPILLNSVIEEKMQRIAEVLLSSVSPFQILAGKLIAGVGVGLTFSATYLLSLSLVLNYLEKSDWIPQGTFVWFFVFLIAGMLVFGSLFAALSSACQDLKDSQNFAGVVVIILVIPLMLSMVAVESPDGPLAVTLSLLPPFAVLGMMLRIAIPPAPPDWHIWLSLFINATFTLAVVWAASRIFRIGILSQGKTPTLREIFRWIFQRS